MLSYSPKSMLPFLWAKLRYYERSHLHPGRGCRYLGARLDHNGTGECQFPGENPERFQQVLERLLTGLGRAECYLRFRCRTNRYAYERAPDIDLCTDQYTCGIQPHAHPHAYAVAIHLHPDCAAHQYNSPGNCLLHARGDLHADAVRDRQPFCFDIFLNIGKHQSAGRIGHGRRLGYLFL